jgi:hypothetical protein
MNMKYEELLYFKNRACEPLGLACAFGDDRSAVES